MNSKLQELQKKMISNHTQISNGARNQQINVQQKIATFNNNYTDFTDRFNELPAFCEHLPNEFKNAMIALKDLHNTPYEFSLSALLGMTNTCCQHLYDVESYKYGVKPISIYIMILLGTGGSKSTVLGELKGPISDFQKRMWEAFKNEDARFVSENKVYKRKVEQYEKDLAQGIQSPFPDKPLPAETANYLNNKFTVNGIIDTLESQPHASLVSAEAGVFFSSHAFQGSRQDNSRAIEMTGSLTTLWDGDDPLSRVIKDERVIVDNRRVNCLFLVQEAVIRDVLNNKTFQEQGFIHRILLSQIQPFDKPKMSFDIETEQKEQFARNGLKRYLNKLEQLLGKRPKMMIDKNFELDPTIITSTHEAKVYIGDWYNQCLGISKPGNKLELYDGFAQRLHEHCIRVAATLAAFNDREVVEITLEDAVAACDIMNMFIDHRSKLEMGMTDTRPELTQNARILEVWFKNHDNEEGYTLRDLSQYGPPNGFRSISAEQRETILADLVKSQIVVAVETMAKNGRKVTKYKLNKEQHATA